MPDVVSSTGPQTKAAAAAEPTVLQHDCVLIYPFRHSLHGREHRRNDSAFSYRTDAPARDRVEHLVALGAGWEPWWRRLNADDLATAKDDSLFFLPHIRELLFPELCLVRPDDRREQSAPDPEQLTMRNLGDLPSDAVLRLTLRSERLAPLRALNLEVELKDQDGQVERHEWPFELCWVDHVLFPQHVGFLLLKLRLKGGGVPVGHLRDFLLNARLIQRPTVRSTMATWRCQSESTPCAFQAVELVDFLLQGLVEPSGDSIIPRLDDYLKATKASARYSATDDGKMYGQIFNVYLYGLLNGDASAAKARGEGAEVDDAFPPQDLIDPSAQRALYELATCTDSRLPDYVPHESYLKELWDNNGVAHWDVWRALALHDNVVFLGLVDTTFTREHLPHNVESDYLRLYLLSFFQQVRMTMMCREALRRHSQFHKNLKNARRLWEQFLIFQDHYWINEVTRKRQGIELYRKFQRGFDVLPLYQQVSSQVRELQEHHERKFDRHLGRLLWYLALIGPPATWILTMFNSELNQYLSTGNKIVAAITWITTFLVVGLYWIFRIE